MGYAQIRRIVSTTIAPPVQRMVVVAVWLHEGAIQKEFLPVVGLRLSHVRTYGKSGESATDLEEFGAPITERGLERDGWLLTDEVNDPEPLVVQEGFIDSPRSFGSPPHYELAACPWPSEQDEERLAHVVERLAAHAEVDARVKAKVDARQPKEAQQ